MNQFENVRENAALRVKVMTQLDAGPVDLNLRPEANGLSSFDFLLFVNANRYMNICIHQSSADVLSINPIQIKICSCISKLKNVVAYNDSCIWCR